LQLQVEQQIASRLPKDYPLSSPCELLQAIPGDLNQVEERCLWDERAIPHSLAVARLSMPLAFLSQSPDHRPPSARVVSCQLEACSRLQTLVLSLSAAVPLSALLPRRWCSRLNSEALGDTERSLTGWMRVKRGLDNSRRRDPASGNSGSVRPDAGS
jgi:hypothetical protein